MTKPKPKYRKFLGKNMDVGMKKSRFRNIEKNSEQEFVLTII